MGLKQAIIDAKKKAAVESKQPPLEVENGDKSFIDLEAQYIEEAIVDFLSKSKFRITQIKAPVILESFTIPDQSVNVKLDTLLGEYQPILKTLKKIGDPLGLGGVIDKLEGEIEKAITPLLEGGAKLTGLNLGKDAGGLESIGYVYIGEDPDSVDFIDVEDEDGQRENTTVHLSVEDIEDLI